MRKIFISTFTVLFILSFISLQFLSGEETIDPRLWEKARKIHEDAIVIDTHCDTPMLMLERNLDIGKRSSENQVDLVRMKEGGLDAIFFAVFISNDLDEKHPSKKALEMIDEIHQQVEKNSDLAEMAYSPEDIRDIHKKGKRAILIGMENGGPIEGSLRLLRDYYRLGVRYITLTHNGNNDICDTSNPGEARWNGVSPFGKTVIEEMNRLGMLIDVSHISDEAFWDVLEISKVPVFASHSCTRSLCDIHRNLTDDMIKALAKKGGVIQLTFCSFFVEEEYKRLASENEKKIEPQKKLLAEKYKDDQDAYWNALIELWKEVAPPAPKIEKLIDHVDHVVKLVGVNHVGFGSDYDGTGSVPRGLEDVSGFPLITYHLLKRGYSEGDIKKMLGGNFLRLFEKAQPRGEGSSPTP